MDPNESSELEELRSKLGYNIGSAALLVGLMLFAVLAGFWDGAVLVAVILAVILPFLIPTWRKIRELSAAERLEPAEEPLRTGGTGQAALRTGVTFGAVGLLNVVYGLWDGGTAFVLVGLGLVVVGLIGAILATFRRGRH